MALKVITINKKTKLKETLFDKLRQKQMACMAFLFLFGLQGSKIPDGIQRNHKGDLII